MVYPTSNPDPRIGVGPGSTAVLRHIQGHRVLYTIGQMGGGYNIYAFSDEKTFLAHHVDDTPQNGWAWYVDSNGIIWWGDDNGSIHCYPLEGWKDNGDPIYDWNNPQTWPWPDAFSKITRLIYVPQTDTLYLFGYPTGVTEETWGVVGTMAQRYDGWLAVNPWVVWTNNHLPTSPDYDGKSITPQSVDLASDYLFFSMVFPYIDGN